VDGDGRLDLVTGSDDCCDREPGFHWFRRGADGRFTAKGEVLVRVAGIPTDPRSPSSGLSLEELKPRKISKCALMSRRSVAGEQLHGSISPESAAGEFAIKSRKVPDNGAASNFLRVLLPRRSYAVPPRSTIAAIAGPFTQLGSWNWLA
jgi:hypothetical protein